MTITTRRFGEVEVGDDDIITFPEGLVGLSSYRRFVMLRDPESETLIWLQSADKEDFSLASVHSTSLANEYHLEVQASEVESIQLENSEDAEVFLIINRIEGTYYANLRGPVIVNTSKMLGKQVVLRNPDYGVRHQLLLGSVIMDKQKGPGAGTAPAAQVSISART